MFTFLIFSLIIPFVGYQVLKISDTQDRRIADFIGMIHKDLLSYGTIRTTTLELIDRDEFFALWVKNNQALDLLIYDDRFFTDNDIRPIEVYKKIRNRIRIFNYEYSETGYVVWINQYKADYYISAVVLPLLFGLLIYFVGAILIILLFRSQEDIDESIIDNEIDEEIRDFGYGTDYSDHTTSMSQPMDDEDYNADEEQPVTEEFNPDSLYQSEDYDNINNHAMDDEFFKDPELPKHTDDTVNSFDDDVDSLLLDEYKKLWQKNFKITDKFKDNFPFYDIYKLLAFSSSPEDYLEEGIRYAGLYFKWSHAEFYIAQGDDYISSSDGGTLDTSLIEIPQNGDHKGRLFIPLYPYNKSHIFGYFCFSWTKDESFKISDILYFLKYFFSNDARFIFLRQKRNKELKSKIQQLINSNNEFFFGVLRVDRSEIMKAEMNEEDITILNNKISESLEGIFNGSFFEIFPLYYGVYNMDSKEEVLEKLNKWISDKDNQNFFISNRRGNVAITYSVGTAFKDRRIITALDLVSEAEESLFEAIDRGGDQIDSLTVQ